jgi:hypothetical protein
MNRRYAAMALTGIFLVCAFMFSMLIGAWVCDAATTPTVNVNKKIEFTIPTTASMTIDPNGSGSTNLSVNAKCNSGWTITVSKNHDLQNGSATIASANFTLTTPTVPAGMEFPATATQCWNGARGDNSGTFAYAVNLTGVTSWWDVDSGAYTATHTYTATAL